MLRFRRAGAACVAGVHFLTNGMAAHAVEKSLWEERRVALDRAPVYARLLAPTPGPLVWKNTAFDGGSTTSQPPSTLLKHLALPFDVASAVLPYGAIGEVRPGRPGAPVVLLVQDVHGNSGAQKNIGGLLMALGARGVTLSGLEGAWDPLELEPYRRHPVPQAVHWVADALRESGRLSGAEWAGVVSTDSLNLQGIESPPLYRANVAAAKECIARRPTVASFLTALQSTLRGQKNAIYSTDLKNADLHRESYGAGRETLSVYAHFLEGLPGAKAQAGPQVNKFLLAADWEARLDFALVESDRRTLMNDLSSGLSARDVGELLRRAVAYRSGQTTNGDFFAFLRPLCEKRGYSLDRYPHFRDYLEYVGVVEGINRKALLSEIEQWEIALGNQLARTPEEKNLLALDRDAQLLTRLLENELSPDQWEAYQRQRTSILALPGHLGMGGMRPQDLSTLVRPHEDFCRLAMARNKTLADNLAVQVQENKAAHSVLVAGGFHTPGLQAEFQRRGYSTVVVTPRIEKVDGKPLDVFARDPLPFDQLFAGKPISLSRELLLNQLAQAKMLLDGPSSAEGLKGCSSREVHRNLIDWMATRGFKVKSERNSGGGLSRYEFEFRGITVVLSLGPETLVDSVKIPPSSHRSRISLANGDCLLAYVLHPKENGREFWDFIETAEGFIRHIFIKTGKKLVPSGLGSSWNPHPLLKRLVPGLFMQTQMIPLSGERGELRFVQKEGGRTYSVFDGQLPVGTFCLERKENGILVWGMSIKSNGKNYARLIFVEVGRWAAANYPTAEFPVVIQVTSPPLLSVAQGVMVAGKVKEISPVGGPTLVEGVGNVNGSADGNQTRIGQRLSYAANQSDTVSVSSARPLYVCGALHPDLLSPQKRGALRSGPPLPTNPSFILDDRGFHPTPFRKLLKEFERAEESAGHQTRIYVLGGAWDPNAAPFPETVDIIVQSSDREMAEWKSRFLRFMRTNEMGLVVDEPESEEGDDLSLSLLIKKPGVQAVRIVGSFGKNPFWEQLATYVLDGRNKKNGEKARRYLIGNFYWGERDGWAWLIPETTEISFLNGLNPERIEWARKLGALFNRVKNPLSMEEVIDFHRIERAWPMESVPSGDAAQEDLADILPDLFNEVKIASGRISPLGPSWGEGATLARRANSTGHVVVRIGGVSWIFQSLVPGKIYTMNLGVDHNGQPSVMASAEDAVPVIFPLIKGNRTSTGVRFIRSNETDFGEKKSYLQRGGENKSALADMVGEAFQLPLSLSPEEFEVQIRKRAVLWDNAEGLSFQITREMDLMVFEGKQILFRSGFSKFKETPLVIRSQWVKDVGLLLHFTEDNGRTYVFSLEQCRQRFSAETGRVRPNADLLGIYDSLDVAQRGAAESVKISRLVADYYHVDPGSISEEELARVNHRIGELSESGPLVREVPASGRLPFFDPNTGLHFVFWLRNWSSSEATLTPVWNDALGLVLRVHSPTQETLFDFEPTRRGGPLDLLERFPDTNEFNNTVNAYNRAIRERLLAIVGASLTALAEGKLDSPPEAVAEEMAWFKKVNASFKVEKSKKIQIFVPGAGPNGSPLPVIFSELPAGENLNVEMDWVYARGPVFYFEGGNQTRAFGLGEARWRSPEQLSVNATRAMPVDGSSVPLDRARDLVEGNPAGLLAQSLSRPGISLPSERRARWEKLAPNLGDWPFPPAAQGGRNYTLADPLSGVRWEFPGTGTRKAINMSIENRGSVRVVQLTLLSARDKKTSNAVYSIDAEAVVPSSRVQTLHKDPQIQFLHSLGLPALLEALGLKNDINSDGSTNYVQLAREMKAWFLRFRDRFVSRRISDPAQARSGADGRTGSENSITSPLFIARPFPVKNSLRSEDKKAFGDAIAVLAPSPFEMQGIEGQLDPTRMVSSPVSEEELPRQLNHGENSKYVIPDGLIDGLIQQNSADILKMRLFSAQPLGVIALESEMIKAAKAGEAATAGGVLAAWDDSKYLAGPKAEIVGEILSLLISARPDQSETVVVEFADAYNKVRSGLLFPKLMGGQMAGAGLVLNLSALFDDSDSDPLIKNQAWLALAAALVSLERDPNTPLALVVQGKRMTRNEIEKKLKQGLPLWGCRVITDNLFVDEDNGKKKFFVKGKFSLAVLQANPLWQRNLKVLGFTDESLLNESRWSVEMIPLDANLMSNLRRIVNLVKFIKISA